MEQFNLSDLEPSLRLAQHPSLMDHSQDSPLFNTSAPRRSSDLPVSMLGSGQFLAIKPRCRGGLIIQKSFYADLLGPGSAVGSYFDIKCTLIYPLGDVQFCAPEKLHVRRKAVQQRLACVRRMQDIVLMPSSLQRAQQVIQLLNRWVGPEETQKVPEELMAQLVGVLPKTIALAREQLPRKGNLDQSPLPWDKVIAGAAL